MYTTAIFEPPMKLLDGKLAISAGKSEEIGKSKGSVPILFGPKLAQRILGDFGTPIAP